MTERASKRWEPYFDDEEAEGIIRLAGSTEERWVPPDLSRLEPHHLAITDSRLRARWLSIQTCLQHGPLIHQRTTSSGQADDQS